MEAGDKAMEDSSPLRDSLGGFVGYDALKNIYDVGEETLANQ